MIDGTFRELFHGTDVENKHALQNAVYDEWYGKRKCGDLTNTPGLVEYLQSNMLPAKLYTQAARSLLNPEILYGIMTFDLSMFNNPSPIETAAIQAYWGERRARILMHRYSLLTDPFLATASATELMLDSGMQEVEQFALSSTGAYVAWLGGEVIRGRWLLSREDVRAATSVDFDDDTLSEASFSTLWKSLSVRSQGILRSLYDAVPQEVSKVGRLISDKRSPSVMFWDNVQEPGTLYHRYIKGGDVKGSYTAQRARLSPFTRFDRVDLNLDALTADAAPISPITATRLIYPADELQDMITRDMRAAAAEAAAKATAEAGEEE